MEINILSTNDLIMGSVDGEPVIEIKRLRIEGSEGGWAPILKKVLPLADKAKSLTYVQCIKETLEEFENILKDK